MRYDPHIPDGHLLQWADGETTDRRMAEIARHLEDCAKCRARHGELLRAMEEFSQARSDAFDFRTPSEPGAAGLMRARLAALASERNNPGFWSGRHQAALAGLAAIVVLAAGAVWMDGQGQYPLKPDAHLTPGATLSMSREQLCSAPESDGMRVVPASLAGEVFHNYGIRGPKPRNYEVDYLITPSLGGATDVRNLWPQPYSRGAWNARVKDALEDHLRTMVCRGAVDLSTAQHEISTDWIAAYRKYFHTSVPLAEHARFTKDPPWE